MDLQAYYNTVIQLSHGIVVTFDMDGVIIHGNRLLVQLTGYTMPELSGQDWFATFIPEEDRDRVRKDVFDRIDSNGITSMSGSIVTRKGDVLYIDWNLKSLVDSSGSVVSVLCVGRDVTEHMLRQKGLAQERDTLLDQNRELRCLSRISMLLGNIDLGVEETLDKVAAILPEAFQDPGRTRACIELDGRGGCGLSRADGGYVLEEPLDINRKRRGRVLVHVGRDDSGTPQSEARFIEDEKDLLRTVARQVALIVAKKEAKQAQTVLEQQLLQADRLAKIGQFSSGLAHEINEPLANILGFAQLALQTESLPRQAATDLQNIVDSTLYAREIIRKLMFFCRQMPPQIVPTDINEIIGQALGITESGAKRNGVDVRCDLDPSLPPIQADPQHIKQVVVNLVANAIQAMERGGRLSISTSQHLNDVYFSVEDTGSGISPEDLKQIFNPFFTSKDVDQGTGLGLSVVHGIVEAHGGVIQVHSELGRGTSVEITFPCEHCNGGET